MTGRYGRPQARWTRECPHCGKRSYTSRKAARAAARAIAPGEALRAYQCGDAWHIGHTPDWVRHGKKA